MEPRPHVRVFIADDHPIVRSGLKALVDAQPDMSVVGEAVDGLEALENIPGANPDLVVMDLSMPKLGGIETTERLRRAHPSVKVLALTVHEEAEIMQRLLAAGASGYVLKRAAAEDLVRAIRVIAGGGVYLDPAVAASIPSNGTTQGTGSPLSNRETEVLRKIAEGHAMKEIASKLEISTRTLETYRTRAMEKLSLKTRADIVQYALRRGWLAQGEST
ncbi:MAG TPA: response regulator transcription factor [Polyangiaceae bacterium]|jgi:DNA-binding NarL/FixJ family response regulator|nr:response regulator transcription factor [Polyangiaceae bacterium]